MPSFPGHYQLGASGVRTGRAALVSALERLDLPFAVVQTADGPAVATGGTAVFGAMAPTGALPLLAWVPALTPDRLGDADFRAAYGVQTAYVAGAMANGIGSVEIVVEMARGGCLGFFGAAGLDTDTLRTAIDRIQAAVGALPWGVNLIHSPAEPHQEQETVDLLIERGVRAVEASAFLGLTPRVVELRVRGLRALADGRLEPARRLMAKISRPEVAEKFLRPAPTDTLRALVAAGRLTELEARLAEKLPMADDLTVEADSGGHTDNRPLPVLLPLIQALRDRVGAEVGNPVPVRIGAAGGIGCPAGAAAAFAMGAAYVVCGTIHQATVEAGTSAMVKEMLAEASMADVAMAPASDMFEGGVRVQVLRRGTMFAMRGAWLYELYRDHASLEALSDADRNRLETQLLRAPVAQVWAECEAFFAKRDPVQLERAAREPKHRMALVFRWYLGKSSRWAIGGTADRRTDVQVWCGPAIGAFNDWTAGTFLARPEQRKILVVAANVMAGAAMLGRAQTLAQQGVHVELPPHGWRPRPIAEPRLASEPRGSDVRA